MGYTKKKFICLFCGKEQLQRRYKQKYCNASCQLKYEYQHGIRDKFKTGERAREALFQKRLKRFKTNPKKHISKRGYWIISIPGRGNVKEHTYVWEKNYGKIPEEYVIHHINLNPLDNRIENLQMMLMKEHHKLHDRLRKRNQKGQYI